MNILKITGVLAILGSVIYVIGDVLLLAGRINIDEYPKLKSFLKLLSDAEKMVGLSSQRMMWGALIGVFATPLILAGFWQVYQGLEGANEMLRFITGILFAVATIIGTFVHGAFFYMGEYVKALNDVNEDSQQMIADMIARHRKVLIITYAPLLILIIIAPILFSTLAGTGTTHFPTWMAAVNPVTLMIAWMLLKRYFRNSSAMQQKVQVSTLHIWPSSFAYPLPYGVFNYYDRNHHPIHSRLSQAYL